MVLSCGGCVFSDEDHFMGVRLGLENLQTNPHANFDGLRGHALDRAHESNPFIELHNAHIIVTPRFRFAPDGGGGIDNTSPFGFDPFQAVFGAMDAKTPGVKQMGFARGAVLN
jgi:hypothetical protein